MSISYSSAKGKAVKPSFAIDRSRINFDSNLRRWFGRNVGLWHSRRQYFFDDEKAVNLDMFINVEKLIQENPEIEVYRFSWWCEDEGDFFIKRPTYKSNGVITARLQGHQLFRESAYLSESSGISNIRQVDEHEMIFESNYDDWYILEHTRLIDQDKFRSRVIYSWRNDKLEIVENHHEIRIKNPN
tara:strand:- start:1532 stop:2089 length:558 start_codon:yes stop_codon:yes gene_type:complete